MKKIIVVIVGPSGSGKTTASLHLQKHFGWNAIVSYTTRKKRKGEKDGVDHWFVTPDKKPKETQICAYTQFGGHEYWTTWNQFQTLFPCVYVIDEKGLVYLENKKNKPTWINLIKIKINRNDLSNIEENRKARDNERIHLPDTYYDYVIDNNGSFDKFINTINKVAYNILTKI